MDLYVFSLSLFFVALSLTTTKTSGDNVYCVEIHKQPAFENDLLKNHKIQERPSGIPKPVETNQKSKRQTWESHVYTWQCPEGFIPIRNQTTTSLTPIDIHEPVHESVHEHAVAMTATSAKKYGAKGTVSVWDPAVETRNEFSLSQIWVTWGSYKENNLNTVEVGWQVSTSLYQDNKPRLFIFWTSDTYVGGCYNLLCPGFIQTSTMIVIGGTITPVSAFEGSQYEITISVWRDQASGNWWLSLGSNHSLVGYWPAEIFANLTYAEDVNWGGEIVDSNSSGRHTTTQMGSGHFPDEGFGKASYFRNLEIVDKDNKFQRVEDIKVVATNPENYNIKNMSGDDWATYFYYGGPGYSRIHSGVPALGFSSFLFYFSFIILFII